MATAAIRMPKREGPLDAQRVIETYLHEVEVRGKRGAYRRTGDIYSVSDERIRQIVSAWKETIPTPEPEPADEPADDLAYTPPPGYDDLLRGIEAARLEARRTLAYQQADEVEALCNRIGDGLTELLNLHSQIQRQRAMTDEERWLHNVNLRAREFAKSANEQALCQVFERERTRPVAVAKSDLAIVPTLLLAVGLALMASVPVVIPQRHGWGMALVCFVGALVACWFAGRVRQVVRDDPFRLIE